MRTKRRLLSLLMAGVMLFSTMPVNALAAEIPDPGGLCEHHPAHTAECGYTEGSKGSPCAHEHNSDCYTTVTKCIHEHKTDGGATSSNAKKEEPENCTHVCSEENGCITKELNCRHEHKENNGDCGYIPASEGTPCTFVCELCNPADSGKEKLSAVGSSFDFSQANQNMGDLEQDGYFWNSSSKTLTLKDVILSGTVTLPDDDVTIITKEDSTIYELSMVKDSSGIPNPQKTKLTFSGEGALTIQERISLSGGAGNALTIEKGAAVEAQKGIEGGYSGVDFPVTVNGTLTASGTQGDDGYHYSALHCGKVRIGAEGSLTVDGEIGVSIYGMNNSTDYADMFHIEKGGAFSADCTEYSLAVLSVSGGDLTGWADNAIVLPPGYLPENSGYVVTMDEDKTAITIAEKDNVVKWEDGKLTGALNGPFTLHENHDFSGDWVTDHNNHWKACTYEGCIQKENDEPHNYTNDWDAECNTCGYKRTPPVTEIPVTGVKLAPAAQTLEAGGTFRLTATVEPGNATDKSVTWTSDNRAVATVDDSGLVTAHAPGKANIIVSAGSGAYTAACAVTVTSPESPAIKRTITYHSNGGGGSMNTMTVEDGKPFTLPACEFTPPKGMLFDVWAIGSPNGRQAKEGDNCTVNADTNVYAVWKAQTTPPETPGDPSDGNNPGDGSVYLKRTITYHANGGGGSMNTMTVEDGKPFTLPACEFTPPKGTLFDAWAIGSPNGRRAKEGDSCTVNADTDVYAVWKTQTTPPVTPDRPSGDGSSNGSSSDDSSDYRINVEPLQHGTVTPDRYIAYGGTKVTLTVTPESGYVLNALTVTDNLGNEIRLTAQNGNEYIFTMPGRDVTVKAAFTALTDRPDVPALGQTEPMKPDQDGNVVINGDSIQDAIDKILSDPDKNGGGENGVSVPIDNDTGVESLTIIISAETLDQLVAAKVCRFDITTNGLPCFSFTFDTLKMLDDKSMGDHLCLRLTKITVTSDQARGAVGAQPAYDITSTFIRNGKEEPFSNWQGRTASVKIPYTMAEGEQTGNLYAVYVDGDGKVEWLTRSSYDSDQRALIFETGHFSIYAVGYRNPAQVFTDIAGHWAADSISFAASRDLIAGTENNRFDPDAGMTRGMLVTALGRLAGIDPESYRTEKFTDVKADACYAPYVNWAAENGVANGTGPSAFSPDANITREQMAVIMVSYANKMGYGLPAAHEAVTFADDAQISSQAAEAVRTMQQAGIMSGKGSNRFNPKSTATRAEAAAVLRRFVEIVIDPQAAQGWMQDHSGSWQYMKDGKAVTGWLDYHEKWYWLDKNGWMFAGGWKEIDGKWYYFYSDGSMAVNTTIDGYAIGPDGSMK